MAFPHFSCVHSSFLIQPVLLWKAVPQEIRMAPSRNSFRIKVRAHLAQNAADSSQIWYCICWDIDVYINKHTHSMYVYLCIHLYLCIYRSYMYIFWSNYANILYFIVLVWFITKYQVISELRLTNHLHHLTHFRITQR